jgi:transposase
MCGKPATVGGSRPRIYCSIKCKAEWQRTQKPCDRDWLYQKYIVEGMDCTMISKIVNRNSKQVWTWIRDYGIPTRKRGYAATKKFPKGMTSWMKWRKHSDETREKIRKKSIEDGRVPYLKNGVHHLKGKRGAETPNWKGGCTPERQAAHRSPEWKECIKQVWKRDNATCQRCKLHRSQARKCDVAFDIHHIVSFMVKERRFDVGNLVLLCEPCHYWVHSRNNVNKEFLGE